tara:strand:+ start:459 stop:656 length:198 start_codon:yes stop_codon:yes gene_type:complete
MTNFSKKFCAKSPFKKSFPVPAWLQSLIRVAPKSSTKNVTKGGKGSKKKDQPYNSDGTPNPNYVS